AAVHLGMQDTNTTGILFYGGEPLMERQLIYDTVAYTQDIKKEAKHNFFYKMTTNGMLLDEDFLKFAQKCNLSIGFSHDGPAQDDCRQMHDGSGTADVLAKKIPLLLKYHPYAVGMSVIDPTTVHKASKIAKFLYRRGFKYITMNLNYDRAVAWTPEKLEILRNEYEKIADMYVRLTESEEKIYLSPIDTKILSHLKGEKYHIDRRKMAQNQPSIAPDGKIYTASMHLNDPTFQIGDVFSGIDEKRRAFLYKKGGELAPECRECAIVTRCNYAYGNMDLDISPIQCAHEQIITPIADRAAEKLFAARSAMFIHKHYNSMYPVLSLIEDI
ncbi:MAG: radical SAM/SPASM domain-containing protein, partial [Defluviitaleaceae bacterium]|nr:radical SAM/SPASM domain-containing protein [Defluviitaleaceae bacterium]